MSTATSILERLQLAPSAARAHAMKNCLSAITMMCTLIERKEASASPRLCGSLRSASLRLQQLLVEHLASEAASPVVTTPTDQNWCSVEGLTASAAERLWARAESAGVSFAISCGGGDLRCHEESLTEALVNLAANAIEATPSGGTVTVQTRQTAEGDQVWVVQDSGCGLFLGNETGAELQPRSTKANGWGIGFRLACLAVARHSGVMSITAVPGEGTTITIRLPREV